jgi:predicted dehydrogenase
MMETFVKRRPLPEDPKKKGRVTADDATLSLVRFANGAVGSIEGSRFATGRKNYNHFEVNGSRGSVAFDLERMNELEYYSRDDEGKEQGFRLDPGHGALARLLRGLVARRPHHRLRAHVHPHYDFLCAGRRQARPAGLRGRRPQPARPRGDREGGAHQALGEGGAAVRNPVIPSR